MRKHIVVHIASIGAVFLMLLRIFHEASIISALLCLFGLAALIYCIRHASSRKEIVIVAFFIVFAFTFRFYGYIGKPLADVLLGLVVGSVMCSLLMAELLFKRYEQTFWYPWIFPIVYILFLYFTEILKINMPFRLDPYVSCMPLLCQITSVLGIYFLDFLLAYTASIAVFIKDHLGAKKIRLPVILYCVVLFSVLCFGLVHENHQKELENGKKDTVRIAYATGPYAGDFIEACDASITLQDALDSLRGLVEDAHKNQAEILILSEEAYGVIDEDESIWIENARGMARNYALHLLLAYEVADTDDSEEGKAINKLCWISADGEILYDYTKHCIIPIIETTDYVRGDMYIEPFSIQVHGKTLRVATAICYDADFDLFMSHMGKDVDLLLLPTWDWKVIAEEHFGVARLRAIAAETTLVRCVYDGWNAVIDSSGKVLMRTNTNDLGYNKVSLFNVHVK